MSSWVFMGNKLPTGMESLFRLEFCQGKYIKKHEKFTEMIKIRQLINLLKLLIPGEPLRCVGH